MLVFTSKAKQIDDGGASIEADGGVRERTLAHAARTDFAYEYYVYCMRTIYMTLHNLMYTFNKQDGISNAGRAAD